MKKQVLYSALLLALTLVTLNSCKKKQEVDSETQTVVDNAICEQQFVAIGPTVNEKGTGSPKSQGFKVAACGVWSVLPPSGTNTVVPSDTAYNNTTGAYTNTYGFASFEIDYGTGGCAGSDNVVRSGKIKVQSTHKWSVVDSLAKAPSPIYYVAPTVTVTLENYKADGITYSGTIILKKTTTASSTTIKTTVTNGRCTNGSWNIEYYCERNVTISTSNGVTTGSVWGTSGGKNREGRAFTTSISQSSPIIKKSNCKYISSGTIDISPDGFKTRTVDFGNGNCDNKATFTVSGQTIEFTMQ